MEKVKITFRNYFISMCVLLKDSLKIFFTMLKSLFLNFKTEKVVENHLNAYNKSNDITLVSVRDIYDKYTKYLVSLLVMLFLITLFSFLSFFKIAIIFFMIFIVCIICIPSYFVFNDSLLSSSRLTMLLISYIFLIVAFAIIFYVIQMLSIDGIKSIEDVAFSISNYSSLEEVKKFDDFFCFIYFSIVTITTLGYGDITPVSSLAKVTSSVEVLLGVTNAVLGIAILFSNKDNDEKIVNHLKTINKENEKININK